MLNELNIASLFAPDMMLKLGSIIWINLLLSGDNALIIALACRELSERHRKIGIIVGSIGAIVARIVLLFAATQVLDFPGVKLAGGLFLLYVAHDLILSEGKESSTKSHESIFAAVMTIIVADVMMSMDNVIAVAAAAHGNYTLLIVGMLISVPMIMIGASVISWVLEKFPAIVYVGGLFLIYLGFEAMITDPLSEKWLPIIQHWIDAHTDGLAEKSIHLLKDVSDRVHSVV